MLYTIRDAFENVPPGTYSCIFQGITEIETKNGPALRWAFTTDDGKTISGLSDAANGPTTKNKTGRWLCALATKPIVAGVQVNPDEYIGKKYLCIVTANENGSRLETFSALA